MSHDRKISVIGLGYVGLPVAVAFAKASEVIGFDINAKRISSLLDGIDDTGEVTREELGNARITFTADPDLLAGADFHIVAVPTPVDSDKKPDLDPLTGVSEILGARIGNGHVVVYESTVYPGATEELCVPILEKHSGLTCGRDFFVGYSPERINPGDMSHRFTDITKVVAAMDAGTLELVAKVYASVIKAGVHRAPSIKVAEAAKVIENTQRDLNIALMNELALIFDHMGIDTGDVLAAAETKWNFLSFKPGLVGGHCIGVDPYYLTYKAEMSGYNPRVILSGRSINDGMGAFVASRLVRAMTEAGTEPENSTVSVLGITFKENIPDIRNSHVIDVINGLRAHNIRVQAHDPRADKQDTLGQLGITLQELDSLEKANAVIIAVAHDLYVERGWELVRSLLAEGPGLVFDVKGILERSGKPDNVKLLRL